MQMKIISNVFVDFAHLYKCDFWFDCRSFCRRTAAAARLPVMWSKRWTSITRRMEKPFRRLFRLAKTGLTPTAASNDRVSRLARMRTLCVVQQHAICPQFCHFTPSMLCSDGLDWFYHLEFVLFQLPYLQTRSVARFFFVDLLARVTLAHTLLQSLSYCPIGMV